MDKTYELVIILDPETKGEEQEKLIEKVKKQISDAEGKVSETKEWGKKELAFPVAKRHAGLFYWLKFSAPAKAIPDLRQKLQLDDGILRFLMVVSEGKSPKKEKAK